MDFTRWPMKGWVYVALGGTGNDHQLTAWVRRGVAFALSLPAK